MSANSETVAILGAGSMGGAIALGLHAAGAATVIVTNRSVEKAEGFAGLDGLTSLALATEPDGNHRAAAAADVVLVGVKPAMVADLLREIAADLRPDTVIVSLAAGTTLTTMEDALGGQRRILRAMPNTPALVRTGVTGLAPNAHATADDVARVRALFETVGSVIETDEEGIDKLSTFSGSGPAYVYLLIEEFTAAAIAQGFSAADARLMAEQTFIGATALLSATGEDPAELRRKVTSPKGTTERAVAVLQDADLSGLFGRATGAALARAKELAAGA